MFEPYETEFDNYDGEDLSGLIGDEWMTCWCDCPTECEVCKCQEGV